MAATITIPKKDARELTWALPRRQDERGRYVIQQSIVGGSRWETIHELVFSWDGVSWMFSFRNPATEMVDDTWWQEAPDEIVCTEVHEVLSTKFVPVESQEQGDALTWANDTLNVLEECDRYDLADQLRRWVTF